MTREEKEKAIKYFKWWKSFNEHTQKAIPKDTIAYKAYQTEIGFYDMAIKALEQEPILDKIYADIQRLRGCSCSCSDGIIDDVEDIIDKYKGESEKNNAV